MILAAVLAIVLAIVASFAASSDSHSILFGEVVSYGDRWKTFTDSLFANTRMASACKLYRAKCMQFMRAALPSALVPSTLHSDG